MLGPWSEFLTVGDSVLICSGGGVHRSLGTRSSGGGVHRSLGTRSSGGGAQEPGNEAKSDYMPMAI